MTLGECEKALMAFTDDCEFLLDRLSEEMQDAPRPSPGLFAKIIAGACSHVPVLDKAGKHTRVARLIEVGAWTDAALALIELELPAWRLRRLVCDSGEWFCSLSRHPCLPPDLDDTADASHEVAALAILRAFVEARRIDGVALQVVSPVPRIRTEAAGADDTGVCCDNFA
jgi:hypothetical protein